MDFMAAEAQTSEQTICSPALLLPLDFNSTMMNTLGPSPRGSYESTFAPAPAPGMQHPDGQVAPLADPPAFRLLLLLLLLVSGRYKAHACVHGTAP